MSFRIFCDTPPGKAAAFLSLLFLGACGSSDSANGSAKDAANSVSPPPFQALGAPDQICTAAKSTVEPEPGQALSPQDLYGAAATIRVANVAAAKALPRDAATESTAVDPMGEPITLAGTSTPLVQGTLYNTAAWPVWYGNGKPVGAVNCLLSGKWHKHMLLSIYNNGQRLGFPDGIGRVHAGCYHAYEMHVHDVTGIIHMESDSPKNFVLGDWFLEWGQPLGRNGTAGLAGPIRFYIIENGQITRYDGDPAAIAMTAHREILIVAGTPLSVVPRYQWPLGI